MTIARWTALALVFAGLCGCAGPQASRPLAVTLPAGTPVAVAVMDRRQYVLSGSKPASYLGQLRLAATVPTDIPTTTGRPLADEFADGIASAFRQSGAAVQVLRPDAPIPAGTRALRLTVREWRVDAGFALMLQHDLTLDVLDGRGEPVASSRVIGDDNLGNGVVGIAEKIADRVPPAFRPKLDRLLADPAVAAALGRP